MDFPFKVYQIKNVSTPAYVSLGKASIAGYYGSTRTYFPHFVTKDCADTYLFASIIGSKNIKIRAATEKDPFIYIDSRWYDFKSTGTENSVLGSVTKTTAFDLEVNFKNLTSDGTLLIKSGSQSKFFWNGKTQIEDPDVDINDSCVGNNDDGRIIIKNYDYRLEDNPVSGKYINTKSVSLIDKRTDDDDLAKVTMQIKKLVGSECIKVNYNEDRKTIQISYNKALCPCGCFDFFTSSSSSSSSYEVCGGLSASCTSSSSSSSNSSSSSSSNSSSSNSSSSNSSSSSSSSSSSNSSSSSSSISTSSSSNSSSSNSSSSNSSSSSSSFDDRCEPIIMADTPVESSFMAAAVATSEDGATFVLGAPEEQAIYIFESPTILPTGVPGYQQVHKVTSAIPDFGWSVSIDSAGNNILVGAPGWSDNRGGAILYTKGATWAAATTQNFIGTGIKGAAETPNSRGHRFGHAVDISPDGSMILIGSPYFTDNPNLSGFNSGAAFRYTGVSFATEDIIIPSDAQQQDYFGWSVDVHDDGSYFVVSAVDGDINGIKSGYVYLYDNTLTEIKKFYPQTPTAGDRFGYSVAVGENAGDVFVAVGSPRALNNMGRVHVFQGLVSWTETLFEPNDRLGFGFSVDLNECGSMLTATALNYDHSYEPRSGNMQIFFRTNLTDWDESLEFESLSEDDGYGYVVDMTPTGSHVIVGAPYYENMTGYARLYSMESDCFDIQVPCGGDLSSSSSSS